MLAEQLDRRLEIVGGELGMAVDARQEFPRAALKPMLSAHGAVRPGLSRIAQAVVFHGRKASPRRARGWGRRDMPSTRRISIRAVPTLWPRIEANVLSMNFASLRTGRITETSGRIRGRRCRRFAPCLLAQKRHHAAQLAAGAALDPFDLFEDQLHLADPVAETAPQLVFGASVVAGGGHDPQAQPVFALLHDLGFVQGQAAFEDRVEPAQPAAVGGHDQVVAAAFDRLELGQVAAAGAGRSLRRS